MVPIRSKAVATAWLPKMARRSRMTRECDDHKRDHEFDHAVCDPEKVFMRSMLPWLYYMNITNALRFHESRFFIFMETILC